MIRSSNTNSSGIGWARWLLAGSLASLLVVPVAQADNAAQAAAPATAAVPPPPPGPYSSGMPPAMPRFRPDTELENNASAYPPGMPSNFPHGNARGPMTRQQFMLEQQQRRKQMQQDMQRQQAEMEQRVLDMQKRMQQMQAQDEAELKKHMVENPAPGVPDPAQMQKQWEKEKAEQDKRIAEQRAEHEKRRTQQQAEQEKRWKEMQAEGQKRRDNYRPQAAPVAQQQPQAAARPNVPPQPPQPGYRAPAYGYGYPPPPPRYGYGVPAGGWGYPGYPAPPPGGWRR